MSWKSSKNAGKLLVLLFCLMLATPIWAELLVSINPRNPNQALYPDEVAFYDVVYFNASTQDVENTFFFVSISDELILVEEGHEVENISFEVSKLEPEQRGSHIIKVKALQPTSTKNFVKVDYGGEVFTHSTSTWLDIIRNPLDIRIRLDKTALDLGEENAVYFDVENNSEATLQDLHVQLIVPEDFEIVSQPSISATVSPGQALANNQFIFRPDPAFVGSFTVTLRVAYKEDGVDHIIEKSYDIDVGQKEQLMYIIIGVILGLIIVSYLLGKKELPKIELISPLGEEKPGKKEKKE
jgi:hypothetical protein